MSQTVIGLDIGSYSVKAAVLETGIRKYQWVSFQEHRWNRDDAGEAVVPDLSEAVEAALEGVSDRSALVTSVPGAKVLNREVELPFCPAKDRDLRAILDFELDGKFPLPIDELVYDFVILERTPEGGAKLLCSAVDKRFIEIFIAELDEAQANPRIVSMDSVAAGGLVLPAGNLSASGPPAETDAVAMIDVGHMTTSLCVVRGDVVEMVRTIKRGGHHITRALMEVLGGTYAEAETLKHDYVRLDGQMTEPAEGTDALALTRAVHSVLEPLTRGLRTTLHAHATKHRLGAVRGMIYGGATQMPGLLEHLSEALGLAMERPNCLSFEWASDDLPEAAACVAPKSVSLALRYVSDTRDRSINFRQGELAFESDFKALKDKWAWLTVMAILLIGIFMTRIALQRSAIEENQASLLSKLDSFTTEHFGSPIHSIDAALDRVRTPPKAEGENVVPEVTAFQAYQAIYEATQAVRNMNFETDTGEPAEDTAKTDDAAAAEGDEEPPEKEGVTFRIETITMPNYGKIGRVHGTTNSLKAMTAFQDILDRNRCFTVTQDPSYEAGTRGRQASFTIRLRVECSGKSSPDKPTKGGDEGETAKTTKSKSHVTKSR